VLAMSRPCALGFFLMGSAMLALGMLITTFSGSPPLPLRWDDAEWGFAWLLLFGGNYLLSACSLSAIIIATDGACGVVWALVSSTLGAVMFCVYFGLRVSRTRTLCLASPGRGTSVDQEAASDAAVQRSQVILGVSGLAFVGVFGYASWAAPLVPVLSDDPFWTTLWALTTVGDYTTCAIAASVLVWWTEEPAKAAMWSVLFLLFGGIALSAYIASRILASEETLGLALSDGKAEESRVELTDAGRGG